MFITIIHFCEENKEEEQKRNEPNLTLNEELLELKKSLTFEVGPSCFYFFKKPQLLQIQLLIHLTGGTHLIQLLEFSPAFLN